jgi:murein L,D-transpeptidase YcbB/YkuD
MSLEGRRHIRVLGESASFDESCEGQQRRQVVCSMVHRLLALRADAELRRRVGHAPGRVERFQRQQGLVVDGSVGRRTLAALGLAA